MKKKFWWIVLAAALIISGCISLLGGMKQPEKKGETEKSENQAELYDEEAPERTPGERTVYLDEMTVPVRDDEVMGTVEFLADDHTEITEEPVATENSGYRVYKKNLGKIETIDGKEWRWKTGEEADPSNIYYEELDFWVPQICGMEDEKRQERLNSLLKTESQERFYLSCADVELYVEYMSEKYLCYSYEELLLRPYRAESRLQIYITIDLEEEKRIVLGDLFYLDDETFASNVATYCVGVNESEDLFKEKLEKANIEFGEYMKMQSGSPFSNLLNYCFFYLRPEKLILAYHEYDVCDLTIELPVFKDYLKVEPWH